MSAVSRNMLSSVLLLVVLGLGLMLAGCQGTGQQSLADSSPAAGGASAPPLDIVPQFSVPWPQDLQTGPVPAPRETSLQEELSILGNQYYGKSANALDDDVNHLMQLTAGAGETSWALYRFGGLSLASTPFMLRLEFSAPLPAQYYVGIADYKQQCWQWTLIDSPLGSDTLGIADTWEPISPAFNLFVVVLTFDNTAATLAEAALTYETLAPPPVDFSATDGESGDYIDLTWTKLNSSYPGLLYDGVTIERAPAVAGPFEPIATVAAGETSYRDQYDGETNPLPYQAVLYYRARTRVGADAGSPCPVDGGFRMLANVANFSSDTSSPTSIKLSWDAVLGADSYDLDYRCLSGPPILWTSLGVISGTTQFEHSSTNPPGEESQEKEQYEYRVRARYLGDTSLSYTNTTGSRNGLPVAAFTAAPVKGYPPLSVDFDASSSSDTGGGPIALFEWDYTTDGTYDAFGATTNYTYNRLGDFTATVRATDEEADSDTAEKPISVPGWLHTWGTDSSEFIADLVVDSAGNTYIGGFQQQPMASYVIMLKYNSAGILQWYHLWDFDDLSHHTLTALGLDGDGNVYFTGHYDNGADDDILVGKCLPDGTLSWAKSWDYGGDEQGEDIAVDDDGNVYIASAIAGTDGRDALLLQFSDSGGVSWGTSWGVDQGKLDEATALAVQPGASPTIFVGGQSESFDLSGNRVLLLGFDVNGAATLQTTWYYSTDTHRVETMTYDAAGSKLYLGGSIIDSGGQKEALLLRCSTAGVFDWSKWWYGSTASDDVFYGIGVNAGGVWLAGATNAYPEGDGDILLLTLNTSAGLTAERICGTNVGAQQASGFSFSLGGALMVCGKGQVANVGWELVSGTYGDLGGTTAAVSGTTTDIEGTDTLLTWSDISATPVEDTGGGVDDALLLKLGPLT